MTESGFELDNLSPNCVSFSLCRTNGRKWDFYPHHMSDTKITCKAVSSDLVPVIWLKGNESSSWELSVNLGHHSGKDGQGNQWEKTEILPLQPFPGGVFMSVCVWVDWIAREEKREEREGWEATEKKPCRRGPSSSPLSWGSPSNRSAPKGPCVLEQWCLRPVVIWLPPCRDIDPVCQNVEFLKRTIHLHFCLRCPDF